PLAGRAQGTFVNITFDGPPTLVRGEVRYVEEYDEAGMRFTSTASIFGRVGGGVTNLPENGTAYIGAALNASVNVSFSTGAAFDLVSVDLAELGTAKYANDPVTVLFAGYYSDGSFVTTQFTTDGLIVGDGVFPDFQTFHFDSRFTGLQRVEIPTGGWWLDNLVVAVPEPSSFVLFGLGGIFAAARLLHQRRSKR
ncbi:MAG: PEP-CTERM sorting domain-containing protein, partial [Verrucomicrobiota bacterium]|nr:PEP-CTERM sorting domain-containing protein [Verrucomicrobiota bacterium]